MRKSLGRIFIFLALVLAGELFATSYKWSAYSSKSEAYVNEAIYLKYVCEFSDRAELYNIDFNPVRDNEDYSVELFSQKTKISDGRRINTYEYIAFVKKPMSIEFNFDMYMKKTTQDSIESTVLGRDNVENEEFTITALRQDSLLVNVKETGSDLVGDFSIDVKRDEADVKAYEPYHLDITLKGNGDFHSLAPIEYKIDNVKVFANKPTKNIELTKDGYVGVWNQKFAFVAENDFKIPSIRIVYFDLKSKSLKELFVESRDIKVKSGFKKEELLDSKEQSQVFDFGFIYYILTFLAGFLVAKVKFNFKKEDIKDDTFLEKVNNAKSINELSMMLALKDAKKYNNLILDIESKKIISLDKAKKAIKSI